MAGTIRDRLLRSRGIFGLICSAVLREQEISRRSDIYIAETCAASVVARVVLVYTAGVLYLSFSKVWTARHKSFGGDHASDRAHPHQKPGFKLDGLIA